MKISKDLNIVVLLPQEDGSNVHVHASPIPLSMFEDNAVLLSSAMMRVYGNDLPFQSAVKAGPKMVAAAVRDAAREQLRQRGQDENGPSAYDALMAEIHRRTMVLVPNVVGHEKVRGDDGKERTVPTVARYESMMMDEAARRDLLDDTDVAEVDGLLLFFSAAWRFHGKQDRRAVVAIAAATWNGFVTSSNSTEYGASLPTSTATGTSGTTAAQAPQPGPQVLETLPDGTSRTSSLPC